MLYFYTVIAGITGQFCCWGHLFVPCICCLLIAQNLRGPPLCIGHMVIALSLLWFNAMGFKCCSEGLILGICWWSQNRLGRFSWMIFIHLFFLAILVLKRFVIYCMGMFCSPIYCFLAKKLCLIVMILVKQVLYLVSTWIFVAITYCKRKIYILEYWIYHRPASF